MASEIKLVYDGQLLGSFTPNPELGYYAESWIDAIVEGFVRWKNLGSNEHYAVDHNEGQAVYTLNIVPYGSEAITVNGEPSE
jgi:hypothetical protein